MSIEIQEFQVRIVVVRIAARLDSVEIPGLRGRLEGMIEETHQAGNRINFVIDLAKTTFMDSNGLTMLVTLLRRTRILGGDVALVWPQRQTVSHILRLTRFDKVFTLFDSAEEALKSFID